MIPITEKLTEIEGRLEALEDAHLGYNKSNKDDYRDRHGFPESWPCKVDERIFSLKALLNDLKQVSKSLTNLIKKLEEWK